jgi:extradiol dioxygenase family protein
MTKTLFHLAFPVRDLDQARRFYIDGLGCRPGRSSNHSLILNLKGHQIVAQRTREALPTPKGIYPRHFGLVFENLRDWTALVRRAKRKRLKFYQKPRVRYEGTPLEHHTVFLQDPSDNLLEFKHYSNPSAIFGQKSYKKVGDRS